MFTTTLPKDRLSACATVLWIKYTPSPRREGAKNRIPAAKKKTNWAQNMQWMWCGIVVWGRKSRFHAMGFGVWIGCHEAFNSHIIIMQHYFTRITACYLFWSCRELYALWLESVYHLWHVPHSQHSLRPFWGGVRLLHLCWWHTESYNFNQKCLWLGLVHACMCAHATANSRTSACPHTLRWTLCQSQKWRRRVRGKTVARQPSTDGIQLKWCFHCDA